VPKIAAKQQNINELLFLTVPDSSFLKDSELPILAHGPPVKTAAIHGHIYTRRKRLHQSESCTQIEHAVGASKRIWDHRASQHDRFAG
jgi:hypothetical protein